MVNQVHQLSYSPLTAHAFNADRTRVAVAPNSNEICIYAQTADGWVLEHTLVEHDKVVTGLDWAPRSNRIVSCSQDRNAYVWTYSGTAWKPTLVLLRLQRGATAVRWSPREDKFAVASSARVISICSFEEDNDWWVAKHIKRPLRSTVSSIDWHPNNVLLAAGSADFHARVFSAYIKGVDAKPPPSVWGERVPFGTVCGEFTTPAGGWVHGVAFSPSGDALAFVGHDASLTIVYPSAPDQPPHAVHSIRLPSLPYVTLLFLSETSLVAAGHDCQPMVFEGSLEQGWRLTRSLDTAGTAASKPKPPPPPPKKPGLAGAPAAAPGVGRLNNEAFARFREADSHGRTSSSPSQNQADNAPQSFGAVAGASIADDGELHTTHQNTITHVRLYAGEPAHVDTISTSGVDGRLCTFDTAKGSTAIAPILRGIASMRLV
ncbi:ARP2/3 actin-organizing complex subunit Sop2 [Malassezia pachydermatis]|uniref:Arp2/3 complex 41 kDa subunit n=1 Tax=Malassezia pachydermatis TaxID=77020 RepID=A0A0M8MXX4_9BASI|nr:arp2 3 protein complex subunit sop2 [Malassezia pachydermatis]KOS15781.1 arp2 3 protein complex subunit sop2 [Malassezia pachydermatis]